MSKNTGQGNNQSGSGNEQQSGDSMDIPRLGAGDPPAGQQPPPQAAAPQQRIVQPGEEPEPQHRSIPRPAMAQHDFGAEDRPSGSRFDFGDGGLKALQQRLDTKAKDQPVFTRRDLEQYNETPSMALEMPMDGGLENMRRPDQRQSPADIEYSQNMDHAAMLAFLEEFVIISVHETGEEGAENPVPVGNNGRWVYIWRGEETIVRRKYVEQLLRAKPEQIRTDTNGRDSKGNPVNKIHKTRALKYPFAILRDDNPRGIPWARKVRAEA